MEYRNNPKRRRAAIRCGYLMVFFMQLISASLILAAFGHNKWVLQGKDDAEWQGSMLVCKDCPGRFADEYYSTIEQDE